MKRKTYLNWKYVALAAVLLAALGVGAWIVYNSYADQPTPPRTARTSTPRTT